MTGNLTLRPQDTMLVDYMKPQRLIADGKGRIIENDLAPVDMKMVEAARAQVDKSARFESSFLE